MAAPALAASMADSAICCGVTGTAGFLPGVSAEPVTAQEIITLRFIASVLPFCGSLADSDARGQADCRAADIVWFARRLGLPHVVHCAKPRPYPL
jgi:hypothetical protein